MKTADGCSQYCSKFPSPELVGFEVLAFPPGADITCICLYSGPNLPTPPAGTDIRVVTDKKGTGPIQGSTDGSDILDCYAFAQVREGFIFSIWPNSTLISH